MNLQKQSYYSVSSSRAPIRNTADYSPFGIQLDGRTLSYVPPAPAPPSVTIVYQHKFDDNPITHPYTTAPNQLNTKLTNVNWLNSQSSWTNFAGFTGKAIATNSATPDTTRLYLNLSVNSGFMLDVKSYSFYHRSSTTGYTNYQLLVNGILVGSGSIFVSSGSTLQSTGTINVANAVAGLTGSVTVTLKLFGGSNGNNATFRLDDFTLNGYTQEVQVYAESYRRGFNGMEKDNEIKGGGNSYDFGARMYDARVGRWLSVDALASKYPSISPYTYALNSPILSKDIGGDSVLFYSESGDYLGYSHDNQRYKGKNLLVVISDKDVQTFDKEYKRKRSEAYKNKNKLSSNQREQHIAGLEAMGTSYDVNDFFDFYEDHKNQKRNGHEVEFAAQMDIDRKNSLDKGGSFVVDESTWRTDYSTDNVEFPTRKPGIDQDFHTHVSDNPYMSSSPSSTDKGRVSNISGRKSVIVSGNTFTVYQADKQGTSYVQSSKKVQITKSDFKNAQ